MKPQTSKDTKENEIVQEIALNVEELEERIAPGLELNHNETTVKDSEMPLPLEIEELEEIVAPYGFGSELNHNETVVLDR